MHLLGSSQGGEDEHDEVPRDEEELRMLRDVVSGEALSRWSAYLLHRSRVVSLTLLCCPPGHPCLILQKLIRLLDIGGSGAEAYRAWRRHVNHPRPLAYPPSLTLGVRFAVYGGV